MRKSPITKLLTLLVLTMTMAFSLGLTASAMDTLPAKVKATSTTSAKVSWTKTEGADKYVVYYTLCHTNFTEKNKKTVAGSKASCVIKGLKAKKLYKFKVRAYSGNTLIAESMKIHHAGSRNTTYTNPKSVTIGPASATLSTGDTLDLTVTIKKQKSGKKLIQHDPEIRFYSTNPSVATVTTDGKVSALKEGSCKIYAVAQNGISKGMSLTVAPSLSGDKVVEKVTEEVYVLSYAWKFEGGRPAADPKLPSPVKLKEGAAVTLATAPALEGYTFKGWDFTGKTMPKKDVVVTGTYVKDEEFTITYVVLYEESKYDNDGVFTPDLQYIGKEVKGPFKKGTILMDNQFYGVNPYTILTREMSNYTSEWEIPYVRFRFDQWLLKGDLTYWYNYMGSNPIFNLSDAGLPSSYATAWPEDESLFDYDEESGSETLKLDRNYVLFAVCYMPTEA